MAKKTKVKVTDAEVDARIEQLNQEVQVETPKTIAPTQVEAIEVSETAITVLPAVVTVDKALSAYTAKLGVADTREANEVTAYVIEKKQAAEENIMAISERLLAYRAKIGVGAFREYIDTVLAPAGIVKEGTLNKWFARYKVLADYIPHETVRKAFLKVGDGRMLIVPATLTKEEKKAGNKATYVISPAVQKAMQTVPLVANSGRISEDAAEVYAKQVIATANTLRKAEPDLDAETKRRNAAEAIRKSFKNFIEAYGTDATEALITSIDPVGLFVLYLDKASFDQTEHLLARLQRTYETKVSIAAKKNAA